MSQLVIDPVTRDYVMSGGKPVETSELTAPAYIRLKVPRTKWLYAPDDKFGSDFYLQKKHQTTADASSIENVAARALQPLVDDGRAVQIDVTAKSVQRGAASMNINITDAQGDPSSLSLEPIGI